MGYAQELLPPDHTDRCRAIGLYATISITGAIEKKRLELSQLTAIRELMVKLATPGAEPADAAATAMSLAAFGPPTIVPLIHELQAEGQTRPGAAEHGLRTLAFQYTVEVCGTLSQVLEDRSRLFTWKTHRRVIILLGDIGCADAVPVLKRYQATLEASDGLSQYKKIVSEISEPDNKFHRSSRVGGMRVCQRLCRRCGDILDQRNPL